MPQRASDSAPGSGAGAMPRKAFPGVPCRVALTLLRVNATIGARCTQWERAVVAENPRSNLLSRLLKEKDVVIADGAMGTNLFLLGLGKGDNGAAWNVERADAVKSIHQGFVDAGSDILLTNTFGANRIRLALHHLEQRAREFNVAGARIAREVADRAGRPVVVAGDIGPIGDVLEPMGRRSSWPRATAAFRCWTTTCAFTTTARPRCWPPTRAWRAMPARASLADAAARRRSTSGAWWRRSRATRRDRHRPTTRSSAGSDR